MMTAPELPFAKAEPPTPEQRMYKEEMYLQMYGRFFDEAGIPDQFHRVALDGLKCFAGHIDLWDVRKESDDYISALVMLVKHFYNLTETDMQSLLNYQPHQLAQGNGNTKGMLITGRPGYGKNFNRHHLFGRPKRESVYEDGGVNTYMQSSLREALKANPALAEEVIQYCMDSGINNISIVSADVINLRTTATSSLRSGIL